MAVAIPVGTRSKKPTVAIVDLCDECLGYLSWTLIGGYAVHQYRVGERKHNKIRKLWMHKLILGIGPGIEVDHRNGNTLDNRRSNLRVVTHAQNMQNRKAGYGSSAYRGVSRRANGRWLAQAGLYGKKHHIGVFDTELEAAQAAAAWRAIHMPYA